MKTKINKTERAWILYDVGNSAFTLLVSTIFPIFFNSLSKQAGLSETEYFSYWSYAASITTFIVVILGPILGTFSDLKNQRKKLFIGSVILGLVFCCALGFMSDWFAFLVVFIISKVGYQASLIFYDSMINDVTDSEKMDLVSSYGFAYGYIGSCIPFILSIAVVLFGGNFGIDATIAVQIAIIINVLWWGGFSIPLFKSYKQKNYIEVQKGHIVKQSFSELGQTFKEVLKNKKVFLFLIAFLFYIDGVYTIISMATSYGEALGLDQTTLLVALLATQIVAFPAAIFLGKLAKNVNSGLIITVCIIAYFFISVYAIFLDNPTEFWILAISVGLFQGTIQALSRSYFAKIIPAEDSGKYFSLMDICGKGASIIGMFLIGFITQLTNNPSIAVSVLSVMFIVGLILFRKADKIEVK